MSAWKKLNQQDAFVTSYVAKKSWTVASSSIFDSASTEVQYKYGTTSSLFEYYPDSADLFSGSYKPLVYRSLDQLYYRDFDDNLGFLTSSAITSSKLLYDHYLESSFLTSSRFLSSSAIVLSIGRNKVGTHIEPSSVTITPAPNAAAQGGLYIENGYFVGDNYLEASADGYYGGIDTITDDGDGILRLENNPFAGATNVGNVIYTHGQVIITDKELTDYLIESQSVGLSWKSNQPIYTYNYNIKVSDNEFNFTSNPSAQSGSTTLNYSGSKYNQPSGILADQVTGSYFQPYITTVGLYNDAQELIAVGKLGQPLPKPANTELTIKIKLDI